ncbi:phosphotransferase [Celeribacter sp.]|uniref:phosphotransferase n=1 Tax=Celeribacter sp. TaxID=1890673 RepID=UPI003A8DF53D
MTDLVTDEMMEQTVTAAGFAMEDTVAGPAALASPSYMALESRSVMTPTAFIKRIHPEMAGDIHVASAIQAATQASEVGAGPKVLWSDATTGAVALERLGEGWKTARQSDLQSEAVMAAAIGAMKVFHGAAPLPVRYDAFARIDSLITAHETYGVALPDDITWLRRVVGLAQDALSQGFEAVPCRNDGSASNLMIGPDGQVALVDFDHAGMNDPMYDLGCLLAELTDFERDMRAAFVAYTGAFDAALFARARLWSHVDDMVHALWARLMSHRSERKGVEWIKYSEWRLLRLRLSLTHPQYEDKIRIIVEAAAQ